MKIEILNDDSIHKHTNKRLYIDGNEVLLTGNLYAELLEVRNRTAIVRFRIDDDIIDFESEDKQYVINDKFIVNQRARVLKPKKFIKFDIGEL